MFGRVMLTRCAALVTLQVLDGVYHIELQSEPCKAARLQESITLLKIQSFRFVRSFTYSMLTICRPICSPQPHTAISHIVDVATAKVFKAEVSGRMTLLDLIDSIRKFELIIQAPIG